MKALYYEIMPMDFPAIKDANPDNVTIMGSMVYVSEFFRNLIRYSSYDTIFLWDRRGPIQQSGPFWKAEAPALSRVRLLSRHQLREMTDADHLVLVSPYTRFEGLRRIRRLIGRAHTPITAAIHSLNDNGFVSSLLPLLLPPLHSYDALVCSSSAGQHAITKFLGLLDNRLRELGVESHRLPIQLPIIPIGIDVDSFRSTGRRSARQRLSITSEPVILYFGRFSSTSKADLYPLLLIVAELWPRYPDLTLILAGDDTHCRMHHELAKFATELGCGSRVRIYPNPSAAKKQELYACADIFVSLADNLQETFGITIVEAMASGLPVIASDWDGYKDIVSHGETGYLVPTLMPGYPSSFDDLSVRGDMTAPDLLSATTVIDLRTLRQYLELLLGNSHQRRTMGVAARKTARTYDWSVVIKLFEELWASLQEEGMRFAANSGMQIDLEWRFREIFDHYPTGFICERARVRLSARGTQWRNNLDTLARIATPEYWFNQDTMRRILEFMEHEDTISVGDVFTAAVERRGCNSETRVGFLSDLCRLMKYGFIDLEDACDVGRRDVAAAS